jgi:tetratricopeptide (TPR) repeat protein
MALALAGCISDREREKPIASNVAYSYLADKPESLRPQFMVRLQQGQRNQVLNDDRLGLATMQTGDYRMAAELFDDALKSIEAVYADNDAARQARSLWSKEAVKDFKGEPYERAMAYYYRGLLYLMDGDYENARAAFKGGMLQDTLAEQEQFRADFALFPYLEHWASRCHGDQDLADDAWKEFSELAPDVPRPAEDHNTLVLVELGSSPFKLAQGAKDDPKPRFLHIYGGSTSVSRVAITAPPAAVGDAIKIDDISRQAMTRGGREVDRILKGKAEFKDTAGKVGTGLMAAGAAVAAHAATRQTSSRNRNNEAIAALAIVLAGAMAKAAADATEPDADARYWDNLPHVVFGTTTRLDPKDREVTIQLLSADDSIVGTRTAKIEGFGGCNLAWTRERSATDIAPRAPNSVPNDVMAAPIVLPTKADADAAAAVEEKEKTANSAGSEQPSIFDQFFRHTPQEPPPATDGVVPASATTPESDKPD